MKNKYKKPLKPIAVEIMEDCRNAFIVSACVNVFLTLAAVLIYKKGR